MPLIKSIAGIRGTIGGKTGDGLTPVDIVKFTTAFGVWVIKETNNKKIVVGRDGRISGGMVRDIVVSTLINLGIDVVDLGLSTTPTTEIAVKKENAGGGIIITASHNPKEWNALKLLNKDGEFINAENGKWVLDYAEKGDFDYCKQNDLGKVIFNDLYIDKHIQDIIDSNLVDVEAIKSKNFKVVVDVINSTGSIAVPKLLNKLGISDFTIINKEITGDFAHNPEPLPENIIELCDTVKKSKADLGIAVDPDVDRLCFVCEDGSVFGEEYTLVAVADYVLLNKKGNAVSNLSSTRALRDITEAHGGKYYASPVGELNVVVKMRETNAVIGGEGNGGVIFPELHYGRDSLIGIALFLTHLAKSNKTVLELRKTYPDYFISKNKIKLTDSIDVSKLFEKIKEKYKSFPINNEDGLKIEFENGWVHLRTSNTEPIIRIFSEGKTEKDAEGLFKSFEMEIIKILG